MKLTKMTTKTTRYIIVYGEDKGFSLVKIKDIFLIVYHRELYDKHYDIAEMSIELEEYIKDGKPEIATRYYLLDPKEALQICGLDEDYFEKDKNERKEVI